MQFVVVLTWIMLSLNVYYSSSAVEHIYVIWHAYFFSKMYVNNVKCMYISAPGHIVHSSEFTWGIYPDIVVSCTHYLIYIFGICGAYLLFAHTWQYYVKYVLQLVMILHIFKNGETICPFSIIPVWLITAMCYVTVILYHYKNYS